MNTVQNNLVSETPAPRHILIMEDESSVADGLELILTEEGYVVDVAMTGRTALDTFDHRKGAICWSRTCACRISTAWM